MAFQIGRKLWRREDEEEEEEEQEEKEGRERRREGGDQSWKGKGQSWSVRRASPLSRVACLILVRLGYRPQLWHGTRADWSIGITNPGWNLCWNSNHHNTPHKSLPNQSEWTPGSHLHKGGHVKAPGEHQIRDVSRFPQLIKRVGNYHSWKYQHSVVVTTSKGGNSKWVIMNDIKQSI